MPPVPPGVPSYVLTLLPLQVLVLFSGFFCFREMDQCSNVVATFYILLILLSYLVFALIRSTDGKPFTVK